jgi:hypothetical protein
MTPLVGARLQRVPLLIFICDLSTHSITLPLVGVITDHNLSCCWSLLVLVGRLTNKFYSSSICVRKANSSTPV